MIISCRTTTLQEALDWQRAYGSLIESMVPKEYPGYALVDWGWSRDTHTKDGMRCVYRLVPLGKIGSDRVVDPSWGWRVELSGRPGSFDLLYREVMGGSPLPEHARKFLEASH